ncbi:MAG: YcfL family protein [Lentisphaeria bacterium]|nr:YcfL family protein [Lentisphaeria bacterium]
MKPKHFLLPSLLVLVGLVCSCQSVPHDPRVRLEPGLRGTVSVTNVITMTNDADFARIQVTLYNRTSQIRHVEARVSWLDFQGMAQDSLTENWQFISLGSYGEARFQSTAPNSKTKDFRVYIQRKRTN